MNIVLILSTILIVTHSISVNNHTINGLGFICTDRHIEFDIIIEGRADFTIYDTYDIIAMFSAEESLNMTLDSFSTSIAVNITGDAFIRGNIICTDKNFHIKPSIRFTAETLVNISTSIMVSIILGIILYDRFIIGVHNIMYKIAKNKEFMI